MSIYLGVLGRLVELRGASAQAIPEDDPFSFERTLEGRVKAQVRPLERRRWSVGVDVARPDDVGALVAFASGEWGRDPFVWVAVDAPVTNLLTPAQSSCDPSTVFTSGVTVTGPLLTPGGWAGRSFTNPTPATPFYFGSQQAPVIPGQAVTASAYLVGAGAAVRVAWYDAAGAFISSTTGAGQGVAGSAVRCYVTATPPATAASALVIAVNASQGARPALTWTGQLFPWADGQGCPRAVIHGLSRQVVLALREPLYGRYSDVSFKITEVG